MSRDQGFYRDQPGGLQISGQNSFRLWSLSSITATLWIGALFFILSLLVKLPYLGTYLTIDEPRWVQGAGQFLLALHTGDLAQTYWHFFPGITTTWGEVIILWVQRLFNHSGPLEEFVRFRVKNLDLSIGAMRLSVVFITSLVIPFIYSWAEKLIGLWPALLGVGLLIVDPFLVAHSRLVNGDAIIAVLMLASFLSFALVLTTSDYKLVFISGILGGLSLLTKVQGLILGPCILLLVIVGYSQQKDWWFWLKASCLYLLSAALIFFLLWPAMWVAPLKTLVTMFQETFTVGGIHGEDKVTFFLGEVRERQSLFFYPLALLYRLTPINMIGFILAIGALIISKRSSTKRMTYLLVGYSLLVIIFATASPKKADRYAMAVIPAVNLLAGLGWVWFGQKVLPGMMLSSKSGIASLILIAGQFTFVLFNYPYVLTYYNPLLGGYAKAVERIPVGRGEGLEQAAAWINSQPDAASVTVSPYYRNVTNPYLIGKSLGFSDSGESQLLADYVVFYITQTQRRLPWPQLVAYFERQDPAHIEYQGKTPYIWIYKRKLPIKKLEGDPKIIGRADLVGYYLGATQLTPGSSAEIILYFLTEDQHLPANEDFKVSLVDGTGHEHDVWMGDPNNAWVPNGVVEWKGQLNLPVALPPGEYKLKVSLMDMNINSEVTFFPFKDEIIAVEPRSLF